MSPEHELDVVDLFAGPGGWSEACRQLGLTEVGYEWDDAACRTRAAAGHLTIRQDVTTCDPRRWRGVRGLIASPPCPDWSQAGRRAGRSGESGWMVDLVPLWAQAMAPEWIACEQVPDALPVWRDHAELYRSLGYSVWTGVLEAERYGVPQTRERAILMASLEREVQPPASTHQRYVPGIPQGAGDECHASLLGPALEPWVSMADALGWTGDGVQRPARTLCGDRSPRWLYPDADGTHGQQVVVDTRRDQREDGSTQTFAADERPAATFTAKSGGQWCLTRPATTVCGDPRLGAPGHRDREGGEPQFGSDAVKLTVKEALILQSFPPDYPVQGNKTKRFEQIGNAVPPLLARHVIEALTSRR